MKKLLFYLLALPMLVMFSCGSDEETPVYEIEIVSGTDQVGFQRSTLPEPVVVKVVDQNGKAQSNVEMSAFVVSGGGTIENFSSKSASDGLVEVNWTLGEELEQQIRISLLKQNAVNVTVNYQTKYAYKTPEQDDDGWLIGDLDVLSAESKTVLFEGIDELRRGEYPEVHSVVIMHDKKLLLEHYFPGNTSNGVLTNWDRFTKHEIQSVSKSFRSMLTGIAIEKGFISGVDVPVFSFFPEHANLNDEATKDDITLEHFLTMSAGFAWDEWSFPFSDNRNNLGVMYSMPSSQWVPYVLGLPMQNAPGSTFAYSTGTSLMLSNIITKAVNGNMTGFTKQYYSDLVEGTPTNNPNGATMTPREMAKLGYIYLYDGKWKDNQVISTDWINKSIQVRFPQAHPSAGGYGYQWWLRTFRTTNNLYNSFYASGNGGQFIVVNKELDLVVVFTGGNFGSIQMEAVLGWMEDHVLSAFE